MSASTPIAAAANNGLREAITGPPHSKTMPAGPTSAWRKAFLIAAVGVRSVVYRVSKGAEM